jgi:hypothetical protein
MPAFFMSKKNVQKIVQAFLSSPPYFRLLLETNGETSIQFIQIECVF